MALVSGWAFKKKVTASCRQSELGCCIEVLGFCGPFMYILWRIWLPAAMWTDTSHLLFGPGTWQSCSLQQWQCTSRRPW